MEAAARREEVAVLREQTHSAEIDLLVAAERGRQRLARLGESRRIQDDRIVALAAGLAVAQEIERVRLHELDVGEPVEGGVGSRALERRRGGIERRHGVRAAGE